MYFIIEYHSEWSPIVNCRLIRLHYFNFSGLPNMFKQCHIFLPHPWVSWAETFSPSYFAFFHGTLKVLYVPVTMRRSRMLAIQKFIYRDDGCNSVFTLQEEEENYNGFYDCLTSTVFTTSVWFPVLVATNFAVMFLIPYIMLIDNYARIGRTLFQSLKTSIHLRELVNTQWVTASPNNCSNVSYVAMKKRLSNLPTVNARKIVYWNEWTDVCLILIDFNW